MPSLLVLVWMSVTSAILYLGAAGNPALSLLHSLLQVSCLFAISLQAGHMEAGAATTPPKRWLQALTIALFVLFLFGVHAAPASALWR